MPLKIRPVRMKRSIYLRVPSDIADLVEIDSDTEISLRIEEKDDRFLLIYSVEKARTGE